MRLFYYLDLHRIEIKNCAQVQEACDARLFVLPKYFYYIENIAEQYSYITTKVPCEAALIHERHMRIEISDFVMRTFVSIAIQNEDSICCLFSFWQRLYFPKGWFPSILYAALLP